MKACGRVEGGPHGQLQPQRQWHRVTRGVRPQTTLAVRTEGSTINNAHQGTVELYYISTHSVTHTHEQGDSSHYISTPGNCLIILYQQTHTHEQGDSSH